MTRSIPRLPDSSQPCCTHQYWSFLASIGNSILNLCYAMLHLDFPCLYCEGRCRKSVNSIGRHRIQVLRHQYPKKFVSKPRWSVGVQRQLDNFKGEKHEGGGVFELPVQGMKNPHLEATITFAVALTHLKCNLSKVVASGIMQPKAREHRAEGEVVR
jgi:hypothetical protein